MIITPHWSAVEHAALTLPQHVRALPDDTVRWLAVAAGVASETGVYTLDDLRREPLSPELPETLHRALAHLLDGTAVYDLDDFRAELRALPREDGFLAGPECIDGQDEDVACPCYECVAERQERAAAFRAQQAARAAERARVRAVSNCALVSIETRVYLPDALDPADEDAVRAWVRANLRRVRDAAQECGAEDISVSGVQRAAV